MIKYIGVNDNNIDLFEGQYEVKHGISYNSYLILDKKIAVLDTVDKNYRNEWMNNIINILGSKEPDYLVIHHMEPDHSANIKIFMDKYKNTKIVSSILAFNMMKNLFGTDFTDRKTVVKENDVLDLGNHKLTFISAPLVHWPEVMFSYDSYEKILFSADGFGKFGSLDYAESWIDEARRYYIGIVGKFGINVINVLKKASNLDIKKIYPLHGPLLEENLGYYIDLYTKWASYIPETDGVCIAYNSIYGNTKEAMLYLEEEYKKNNIDVEVFDLARCDTSDVLAKAFMYSNLILASPTYNGDIFPYMKTFINSLIEHNYQNRKVVLIENGMWAPAAVKVMKSMLEGLKNITISDTITIKGAFNDDIKAKLDILAKKL